MMLLLFCVPVQAAAKTLGTTKLKKISAPAYNKVKITWNKTGGAESYRVYRKTDGKWKYLGSSTTTSYTDKDPAVGTNTYTVRGVVSAWVTKKSGGSVGYVNSPVMGAYDKKGVSATVAAPTEAPNETDEVKIPNEVEINAMVKEVIKLTNKERVKAGLTPLKTNANLQKGAMVRAKEISILYSHTRPNGLDYETANIESRASHTSGENIAAWCSTSEDVMTAWMGSTGHKNNILLDYHQYIGVGLY